MYGLLTNYDCQQVENDGDVDYPKIDAEDKLEVFML